MVTSTKAVLISTGQQYTKQYCMSIQIRYRSCNVLVPNSGIRYQRYQMLVSVMKTVPFLYRHVYWVAHHIKFVRASCVKFHTLLNNNKGQIRLNLISRVFTLNTNFPGYQFLVEKSVLNGRNGTVFALRFSGPPSWMQVSPHPDSKKTLIQH